MEFLGIGPLELLIIVLIGLIVLGPKDIVKAGQTAGRFLRKVVTSPYWSSFQKTSRELKNLPNRLIREAGIEEMSKDISKFNDEINTIGKDISAVSGNTWKRTPSDKISGPENDTDRPSTGRPDTANNTSPQETGYSVWLKPARPPESPVESSDTDAGKPGLSAWITPPDDRRGDSHKISE